MTLALPAGHVIDPEVQANFEVVRLQFPINATNLVSGLAGTTFPTSPQNGQEYYYVADATLGIVWHFKYRAASASASKWEFVGGPSLTSEVVNSESLSSASITTFFNLATNGPTVTLPRAGDYEYEVTAQKDNNTAGSTDSVGLNLAGAAPIGANTMFDAAGVANKIQTMTLVGTLLAQAAGTIVLMQYSHDAGTTSFRTRKLRIRPVRVS